MLWFLTDMSMERRAFLTLAASGASLMGAGDKVRGGIIGSGGRGRYLTGRKLRYNAAARKMEG